MTGASIAAIVLAAGQGERFGAGANKLLVDLDGRPLLWRAAHAALASRAFRTIVVTGHARADVEAALYGLPLDFAHNPDFASGLASSLRVGLSAVGVVDGALVLLGDMPAVSASTLDALIAAFENAPAGCPAVVPVNGGRRGNPALLARKLFPKLAELGGDEGARRLLKSVDGVVETPIDDDAIFADVDTRDDFDRLRARPR
jgi:molybdenum cofactor cytidylyltransferase